MSKLKHPDRFRVTTDGPDYLVWRSELLAELAVMRVTGLTALKPPNGSSELPFQLVAASAAGVCFQIEVAAYSSYRLKIEPEALAVLELAIDAGRVRAAGDSATPVVLFLFDGDRDHGRYVRLDTLPKPAAGAKTVVLAFPVENTITGDSVRGLAAELARERRVPVAG